MVLVRAGVFGLFFLHASTKSLPSRLGHGTIRAVRSKGAFMADPNIDAFETKVYGKFACE
jgi:hypothetical protein